MYWFPATSLLPSRKKKETKDECFCKTDKYDWTGVKQTNKAEMKSYEDYPSNKQNCGK